MRPARNCANLSVTACSLESTDRWQVLHNRPCSHSIQDAVLGAFAEYGLAHAEEGDVGVVCGIRARGPRRHEETLVTVVMESDDDLMVAWDSPHAATHTLHASIWHQGRKRYNLSTGELRGAVVSHAHLDLLCQQLRSLVDCIETGQEEGQSLSEQP